MKKHLTLLLLFFAAAVFSQQQFADYTKITAYRLIDTFADGPCSIEEYMNEGNWFIQKQELEDCPDLIKALLQANEDSKNWKKRFFECREGCWYCENVEVKIAIEYNKFRFQFLMDDSLTGIFDPQSQQFRIDENHTIRKLLYENALFSEFFETDFDDIKMKLAYENANQDTIDVKEIRYKGQSIYGLNRHDLEKLVGGFKDKYTTKRDDDPQYHYSGKFEDIEFNFDDDQPIKQFHIDGFNFYSHDTIVFDIGRLKIGDNVQKLREIFPASTAQLDVKQKYFPYENECIVGVDFNDKRGYVNFTVKDDKIIKAFFFFNYRN